MLAGSALMMQCLSTCVSTSAGATGVCMLCLHRYHGPLVCRTLLGATGVCMLHLLDSIAVHLCTWTPAAATAVACMVCPRHREVQQVLTHSARMQPTGQTGCRWVQQSAHLCRAQRGAEGVDVFSMHTLYSTNGL